MPLSQGFEYVDLCFVIAVEMPSVLLMAAMTNVQIVCFYFSFVLSLCLEFS